MTRKILLILCTAFSSCAFGRQAEAPLANNPSQGISISSVIQSFAAKETEFKQAHEQYSYTEDVTVRASCRSAQPGAYHLIADVMPDRTGKPVEKIKAVDSTLQCISITKEDVDSFRNQSLLSLTTDAIQDYQINFVGQQQQGGLVFYLFGVSPATVQPGKAQFNGRIWVESRDLVIVKSYGTIAIKPVKKRKEQENLFPAVTTWREQIDGRYWFPMYSRANDVLHFPSGDVQVDETIKFTNYRALTQHN